MNRPRGSTAVESRRARPKLRSISWTDSLVRVPGRGTCFTRGVNMAAVGRSNHERTAWNPDPYLPGFSRLGAGAQAEAHSSCIAETALRRHASEPENSQPGEAQRGAASAVSGSGRDDQRSAWQAVTSSVSDPAIGDLEMITDGDKSGLDGAYVELGSGPQWIVIDLKQKYTLYAVVIWHYHKQARVYRDVIVQVADDPDFITGVSTVFNNDTENAVGWGSDTTSTTSKHTRAS